MSTDVAVNTGQDVAVPEDVAAAIWRAQQTEYDDEALVVPMIKIGQGLTAEVTAGDASVGEFIHTLTGESLGDKVHFAVAYYNKGYFATGQKGTPEEGRAFTAYDSTIPASWEPLVGAEFVGTPFSEHPEAEVEYKRRVNDKEIEWGHGPMISTTHNYTGMLVDREDDEGNALEPDPVRISLKRIDVPGHRKINTLLRAVLRNKPTWDRVLALETTSREFKRNKAYLLDVTKIKFVRDTTDEERQFAAMVAQAVMGGRAVTAEVEDVTLVEPKSDTGGLAI